MSDVRHWKLSAGGHWYLITWNELGSIVGRPPRKVWRGVAALIHNRDQRTHYLELPYPNLYVYQFFAQWVIKQLKAQTSVFSWNQIEVWTKCIVNRKSGFVRTFPVLGLVYRKCSNKPPLSNKPPCKNFVLQISPRGLIRALTVYIWRHTCMRSK